MTGRSAWVAPLGASIACLMLASSLRPIRDLSIALVLFSGGFALAAVVIGLRPLLLPLLTRKRYDLNELRRLDEQIELDSIEVGDVSKSADEVVCARCGNAYRSRFPACPFCRSCN